MLRMALAALLLVAGLSAAHAERRVALVVGNAGYHHAPALRNPRNDAEDVAKALSSLGFEVTSGLDLDEIGFSRAVASFSRILEGADVAVFYYAGHAVQLNERNYLLPTDARVEDEFGLKREGLLLSDITGELGGRAKVSLLFLDACRDNPFAERLKRAAKSSRSTVVGRGLARVDIDQQDTLMVFATAPGQVAADGDGRNSPFTAAFLAHVAEPGVEVESVMKRVTASVRAATKGRQEPERLSRLTSEFYFARAEPVPEPVAKTDPAAAAPQPEDDVRRAFEAAKSIGSAAALEAFLKSYPTGVYADLARAMKAGLPAPKPPEAGRLVSVDPAPAPAKPAMAPPEEQKAVRPVLRRPPLLRKRPPRIVEQVRRRRAQVRRPDGGCFLFNGKTVCD
jgi:uncharacterized caspase-like protein